MLTVPVIIMILVAGLLLVTPNSWVDQQAHAAPNGQAADTISFDSDGVGIVPADWALIPSTDLQPGDSFRLMFVTSDTRDAQSSNIADYNSFVQQAAARNTLLSGFKGRFRALASTRGVHAKDNAGTTGTGVPIYWVKGAKVADSYTDFYDGSWASKAGTDEQGKALSISTQIWTGTNSDGTEHASELGGSFRFAHYDSLGVRKPFGTSGTSSSDRKHLYALSPVLKVALGESAEPPVAQGPPDPTPTPAPTPTPTPASGESNGSATIDDGSDITPSVDIPPITDEEICSSEDIIPPQSANPALRADCLTLLDIKGDLAKKDIFNWGSSASMSAWDGVTLGGVPMRVTKLDLSGYEVDGSKVDGVIPSKLGDLSRLEILELNNNALTGGIPISLGKLSHLTQLRLSHNKLTGSIPVELGNLTELRELWLNDNSLSGRFPAELGDMRNLRTLRLIRSGVTGCIPDDLLLAGHSDEVGLPWCNPASGAPVVVGTAQVGQTLEVNTFGISDLDGLTSVSYSYQWLADDAEISGATSSTYKVRAEDEGKAIKVRVDFTDDKGNPESLTSGQTEAVVAGGL